jgi:L-malate glycosyltransferase
MRIALLDANYPDPGNVYGDVFVHVRAMAYAEAGHDLEVCRFFKPTGRYTYEGIDVVDCPDVAAINGALDAFAPDVIGIHFYQGWMLRKLLAHRPTPVVTWVHGFEALWFFRRLFNVALRREFFDYVKYNLIQMVRLRQFVQYANRHRGRFHFVFVSDWMRRVMETDIQLRVRARSIVPNPIDANMFTYVEKRPEDRLRVLLVRSFTSRKYANDLAVAGILRLAKRPEFQAFRFTIVGKGPLFAPLTAPLCGLPNVELREAFLSHDEVKALHETHGVFLCPTRQDAQGVSMCEAMASGLVPVTSASTAIPEFVEDGVTGFLTHNPQEIADALLALHDDPARFARMSAQTAASVRAKAGLPRIVDQELALLGTMILRPSSSSYA